MEKLNRHFGLVIAFILPGFVALSGVAPLAPNVSAWLHAAPAAGFGAPLYVLLAAAEAGMVASCFRWLIVDRLHELSGVAAPSFNPRALAERPAAFDYLVESHYRYYQFYANTLVAAAWAYAVHRWAGDLPVLGVGSDLGVLLLCGVLFAGSRDALSKYRDRTRQLLGDPHPLTPTGEPMTNGIDHGQGSSGTPTTPAKPAATPAPKEKPQAPAKPQPEKEGQRNQG
jgi:hypothetical protein